MYVIGNGNTHVHILDSWTKASTNQNAKVSVAELPSAIDDIIYVLYCRINVVLLIVCMLSSPHTHWKMSPGFLFTLPPIKYRIMQIVHGGKVSRLHDLVVIRGKTFAIV